MTGRFWLGFLFSALLSVFPCVSQTAQRQDYRETLGTLSQQMHEQLDDLKQQSQVLTTSLAIAESDLQLSQEQVKELQAELAALNTCLENTNRKLSDYSTKLTAYEVKLKQRAKIIAGLMGILLVLILIKIVFVFLYIKHIPIPRIVDILA